MDNINFASANSTFDNLEPYVLSSTKEEMDTRKGLEDYRKNGAEEQSCKGSLRAISSAIQHQLSPTNDCKCEWSHNLHSYPRGCSLLPLHDKLSPPKEPLHDQPSPLKEKSQEKEKGIHIPEIGEISFSASRTTSSMDNYNGESRQTSNSNQCFLESRPGEDYQRCIWCVNFSSQRDKERNSFITTNERPIPFSSGTKWRCDFRDRKEVAIRELCGDECLDFLMPAQNRSSNQDSNNIDSVKVKRSSNVAMPKLQSLPELVDAVRNNCGFQSFNESQLKYEYNYGMTVLFLDSRGILFEWCEFTKEMYVLGINEMEGLANILYHLEKKLMIMEDTGEMIPDVELKNRAKEFVKATYANLKRLCDIRKISLINASL